MDLGRGLRRTRRFLVQNVRPKILVALVIISLLAGALLWQALPLHEFWPNLALNLGADLIGAIVVIFVVSPLITRAQQGRVREHRRLDYSWFTDQVSHATAHVRILDTFTGLLNRPGDRFFRVTRDALARHVRVRILLIDPDSRAAEQRSAELGEGRHNDVRSEVVRNVTKLVDFQRRLDERAAARLEIRLYSASASVTLYRWDDHALVSFLPIGRLSGEGTQLEITSGSPLWAFVDDRFDELWRYGRPVADFFTLTLDLHDGTGLVRRQQAEYVFIDEEYFIDDPDLLAAVARQADGVPRAQVAGELEATYELDIVAGEAEILAPVRYFEEKYGRSGRQFVRLRPATDQQAGQE